MDGAVNSKMWTHLATMLFTAARIVADRSIEVPDLMRRVSTSAAVSSRRTDWKLWTLVWLKSSMTQSFLACRQ
ncbi:hypothetical protein LINPERHAP2_LOCUS30664 [Linum perenne]